MPNRKVATTNAVLGIMLVLLSYLTLTLNATPTTLAAGAPIANGDRAQNQVALIFIVDDVAAMNQVPDLVTTLTTAGAGATFFLSGVAVLGNLDLTKTLAAQFELGNYGFTGNALNGTNRDDIHEAIGVTQTLIATVTDTKPQFFYPPNGRYNKTTLTVAASYGLRTIVPTARRVSIDWQNTDVNLVTSYATVDTKGGDIIALRVVPATVQSLARSISTLRGRGLDVTALGTLLG